MNDHPLRTRNENRLDTTVRTNPRAYLTLLAGHIIIALAGTFVALWFLPNWSSRIAIVIFAILATALAGTLTFVVLERQENLNRASRAELHQSRENLRIALRTARMGTWDWNLTSGKMYWSEDVHTIFGLEPGDFGGTFDAYLELLSAEEQFKVQKTIHHVLASDDTEYHFIHSIQTPQGETRWLEGRGMVERNDAREPTRVVGMIMDVTARVQAEYERALLLGGMEKRNTHLNTAARVSKTCNSILDPAELTQEAVTLITEGFDLYYVGLFLVRYDIAILHAGYGAAGQKMLDEGYFLNIDEKSMIGWTITHRAARVAQRAVNDEVRHNNPYLPETRSELSLPLISRGTVIGALTFQSQVENAFSESDISILQTMSDQLAISIENARLFSDLQHELEQRGHAEQERESLILELEAKNAELERFTYTVSHDLKSPLITIRGFLGHLLEDSKNGDEVRVQDDARRIADATNRMQRLLDELLELSRVGKLVGPAETVPFEQIVHEALALVEGRIAGRGIEVQVATNLPTVRVDRTRMVEALQNLLDNSAKFMGDQVHPRIEIGTSRASGPLAIFVRDNGIGIDSRFQTKVFGLFDKLDPASEGTGVGLALVKRIIEVHGGRIWLESSPGSGTTFYFTLPLD